MASSGFPCPSCGFLVFGEAPGSYEVCPVCGWEDDPVQLAHPTLRGGANKACLLEWQRTTAERISRHNTTWQGYKRDTRWRPLRQEDLLTGVKGPQSGLEYFHAAAKEAPEYYWRRK